MTAPEGQNTTVAFVGLGVMGLPMLANVASAGFDVRAFDVAPQARETAREHGHTVVDAAADALAPADVVITMLPDTPHVEQVSREVLANCRPGTLLIDMSTISPLTTVELARTLADAGMAMVDAPVSGGVKGAVAGALSIMVGGAPDDVERARPVLASMGTPTCMGPSGAGQATKACNQVAVAINIQAVCEALTLGVKLGVEPELLRKALLGGSAASWVLENLGRQMIDGDDRAGFRISLQVKDLRIATDAAARTATPLPGAFGVQDLYLEAIAQGEEANGNQALSRVYERLAAVNIARD
ncbi:NAD(P)-dependent oxidoreductase [Saccharopolyspora sp. K220]|uniref:NAD(P)-dependent oxidoreductase n=1 Tax=Saccharopolyspora soli TaxID=2926618 RepID=UPI001F55E82C|nr:NAD(P)-dependent oxidoreductase [Saccharopolyspora soli]MCI2418142.1 NAD(P)-dependent oxidoreductase [Saccharopolyspora soli]